MSENYEKMKRPPISAIREIAAGDLKGKSDINPQWRYEIMDEVYGPCGKGWKFEIVKLWDYPTVDGTILCFAQIDLLTVDKDTGIWNDAIPGLGGNTLVDMVKGYNPTDPKRAKPNDEGYKMAITDALGTAMKMLGVAADIYRGNFDGSKYRDDKPAKRDQVDIEEYTKLKNALIDYINSGSFEHPENVEKVIADKNIVQMKKALEAAKAKEQK